MTIDDDELAKLKAAQAELDAERRDLMEKLNDVDARQNKLNQQVRAAHGNP